MIRTPIQYPGPLGLDAPVTVGTAYPNITITAPLGPEFQAIPSLTNNAAVDLATFVNTDQVIVGPIGTLIYKTPLSVANKIQAERFVGA